MTVNVRHLWSGIVPGGNSVNGGTVVDKRGHGLSHTCVLVGVVGLQGHIPSQTASCPSPSGWAGLALCRLDVTVWCEWDTLSVFIPRIQEVETSVDEYMGERGSEPSSQWISESWENEGGREEERECRNKGMCEWILREKGREGETEWVNEWVNEWSQWENESVSEWTNEWVSEWMSE